jgi:hypothetical protein
VALQISHRRESVFLYLMCLCSCWITTPSVVFLFVCTHRYWYEAHVSHHLIFSWSFVSLVVSLRVHCLTSCLCPFFCHTLSNSCSASFWQFWPIEPLRHLVFLPIPQPRPQQKTLSLSHFLFLNHTSLIAVIAIYSICTPSDVELMVPHNLTCRRPVHGVG